MWNRKIHCFSIVASPIYIPTNSAWELLFLCILTNTCYFFFLTLAILSSEAIFHGGFDLHFSDDVEHLFKCLFAICFSFLEECLFRSSANFLNWLVFCFCFRCWVVLVHCVFWIHNPLSLSLIKFGYNIPNQIDHLQISSPIQQVIFSFC